MVPATLPRSWFSRTLKAMEVHFTPDLEAKLDKLATETGRPTGELVEDVIAAYLDELAGVRETLNSRYDDLKSGRVQPIDGEEAFARLKAKTEAQRNRRA
ncbi:MAG TPA: ribbon-helix-helix protein, CopG family [Bryobacteraceae bacterium]|nr:ribbon-helix-helix protein, CopG family [Bryobacteraceae bacterium]